MDLCVVNECLRLTPGKNFRGIENEFPRSCSKRFVVTRACGGDECGLSGVCGCAGAGGGGGGGGFRGFPAKNPI